VSVSIRRAEPRDADFLLELMTHEDVDPFMAVVRPRDRDGLLEEIERSQAEPKEFGRFVIELDGQPVALLTGLGQLLFEALGPFGSGWFCHRSPPSPR